jgi:multiple sugar transport system substrate-binding protein
MWWDGELYSMPMPTAGGETSLYIYDKDAFAAAGLDPENPPTTWQELWDASVALNERDGNVINTLAADINVIGDNPAHGFLAWLYTNNGALYSEDLRSVAFNSPEGVETLQWMLDYINEFYGGIENIIDFMAGASSESPEYPLFQGRMGVMFPNVSIFGHVATYAPDLNYGVALRPYNADNPDASSQGIAPLGFGWGYVIPTGLDEATERAAYNWVRRITYDIGTEDAPGACFFMQEQARPSPLIECNADPIYYELNPAWDNVIRALESDVALPIVPPQSRVIEILNQYVELAFFGEFSVQDALDAAADEANAILDEYWSSIE